MALIMISQLFSINNRTYAIEADTNQESSEAVETTLAAETEAAAEAALAVETEAVTDTEAVTVAETEAVADAEVVTDTEAMIDSEAVSDTEIETELETEELQTANDADQAAFQNLSKAIVEAAKTDSNLWNQLMMAMYSGDEDSIDQLAAQFEVETEVMQQYLAYMGTSFSTLYDAMDDETLDWEDMQNALDDESLLNQLAAQFGIDTGMLLLFIQYNMAAYGTEVTAETGGTDVGHSISGTYTSKYSLVINGQNYVAFSLNKAKSGAAGMTYTQKKTDSNWTSWFKGICASPWNSGPTNYWLIYAVSYCATYYNSDYWLNETVNTYGFASYEASDVLRQAIQQAIWFWTDNGNTNSMPNDTPFQKLALAIKNASYNAANNMPSPFNWNWYVPSSTSTAPYLLVAGSPTDYYVGFSGAKVYSSTGNTNTGTFRLYIMPYSDYISASSASDRTSKAQIAYCFNQYLHYPFSDTNGLFGNPWYDPRTSGYYNLYTETDYANFAKDQIKAIALNGYPHNVSGFYDASSGITEDQFYVVTQRAIWYYTDGYEAGAKNMGTAETELFWKLVNTSLSATEAKLGSDKDKVESYINLFESTGQPYDSSTGKSSVSGSNGYVGDKAFQNLLTVSLRSDAYNLQVPENGTLTVGKTVTTASGSTTNAPTDKLNTSFSFEAVFKNNGAAYTDAITWTKSDKTTGTLKPDATGKVTFSLTGGQTITMTLPTNVAYQVTETNIPTDFTLVSPTSGASGTILGGEDTAVTFTNKFADTVNISGTKTWVNDDANTRPSQITLQLWQHIDDTAASADTLVTRDGFDGSFNATASNNWIYTFSGMPKYANGKQITYYVKELNVPDGYTSTVNGMDVTNTYATVKTYSLTLKKEVSGKFADKTKAFEFSITLKDKDGQKVTDSFDVETSDGVTASTISNSKIKFTNGTTMVYLAHGQSIEIKNIPEGYTYEISENLDSGSAYSTTVKVEYTDSTGASSISKIANSTGTRTLASNETVTYTNTREDIVPSGVRTDTNIPVMISGLVILLAVMTAGVYVIRRRRGSN
jgi:TQXA domain-containing protein